MASTKSEARRARATTSSFISMGMGRASSTCVQERRSARRQIGHLRIGDAGDGGSGGIDLDRRDDGRRLPRLQQRFGHQQVAARRGMHAVGHQLLSRLGVQLEAFSRAATTGPFRSATLSFSSRPNSLTNSP